MISLLIAALCNGMGNFFIKLSSEHGKALIPLGAGITFFGVGVLFYSHSLTKFSLTVAYPTMFAIATVLAVSLSHFFLKESFSLQKGIGIGLIAIGTLLLMVRS